MRHLDRKAAIGSGHAGDTRGRTIRIVRIDFTRPTGIVEVALRNQRLRLLLKRIEHRGESSTVRNYDKVILSLKQHPLLHQIKLDRDFPQKVCDEHSRYASA